MEPITIVLVAVAMFPYVCGAGYVAYATALGGCPEPTRGRYHRLPTSTLTDPLLGYEL